jgi:aminocarboxymuconate-semialdehyde decarboxylase
VDDGHIVHPDGERYPFQIEYYDPKARSARLKTTGIDIDVLSIDPSFLFYSKPGDEAIEVTRLINDAFAAWSRQDDRFWVLASLPLQAPEEAAAELERAVVECGAVGAFIGTTLPGDRSLDQAELEPVFAAADRLGTPLVLHPLEPKLPPLEGFHLSNAIGNPLATTIAAARLIFSGTLDRFPKLKIVLVHGGGFLPYQLGRLDRVFLVRDEAKLNISAPPSSYLDRFWIDTITHSDSALAFLASTVGIGRLVLGTDFPFDMQDPDPLARFRRIDIDPLALGETVEALFGRERSMPAAQT